MTLLSCCLQNLNFWDRNQGTFLGFLGAGIVAILAAFLSSFLTYKKAIKKDLGKESYMYSGLLSLIHTELDAHKAHLTLLINSLNNLKKSSIVNETFVIDKLPMQFDISLINKGLFKLCSFKNYDHRIMIYLVTYKNLIMGVNIALEFNNANELLSKQKNINNAGELIESYFNVLNSEYLSKIGPLISEIKILIERKVNKSDLLIFRELNEK